MNTPTLADFIRLRRLRVRNPENGMTFAISLRSWHGCIFAVRVHPPRKPRHKPNPFIGAHRILPRAEIESWLARLETA